MKFVELDADGLPVGFYSQEVHGENIPASAVQIEDAQWRDFIENPGRRRWSGGKVVPFTPTVSAEGLKNYATTKRQQVEAAGVALPNGVKVSTTETSQMKVSALRQAFDNGTLGDTARVAFKAQSSWIDMGKADVQAVYLAIVTHVQTCYAVERSVVEGIDAGRIKTTAQVDNAPWPSSAVNPPQPAASKRKSSSNRRA